MKSHDAVIVVADIEESSEFAQRAELKDYNRMVREYHELSHKAILRYQRESRLKKANLEGTARGDEVVLIVHGLGPKHNALHALKLALLLREAWLSSEFNRKRIKDGKDYAHVRVGIGAGQVAFESNPWAGEVTPEGFAISQAKRIEGEAGAEWVPVKVLVKATLRPYIEQGMPSITIGQNRSLGRLKGVGEVEVFPVEKYDGWFKEFQQAEVAKQADVLELVLNGYAAGMAGKNLEAERAYRKAILLEPASFALHYKLGFALRKQEKLEEAEKELRASISLKPDYIEARVELGIALAGRGLLDAAIEEFRWVVGVEPNSPGAHYNLGLAYKYKRLYLEATKELQKALDLGPNYLEAYLELGETLHLMGNIPQSRTILIDALGHISEEERRVRIIQMLQKTDADITISPLMLAPCPIMPGIMKNLPVKLTGFERTQASFIILSTSGKLGVGRKIESGKPKPIDDQFPALEANICRKIATLMDSLNQRVDGRVYWERQFAVEQDQVEKDKILKRLAERD